MTIFNTNNLHTIKLFKVFQSNNFQTDFYLTCIWDLTDTRTMKRDSTLSRTRELKPHHQMQFSVIPLTLFRGDVLPFCRR